MTLEDVIKAIEARGLFWAIEGGPNVGYTAVIEKTNNYVGDGLAGPGVESGETPAEALLAALNKIP